jgi:Fe2+ or Zn2+ uptake regulation protein
MRINLNSVLEGTGLAASELRQAILFFLLKGKSVKKSELLELLLQKNPKWTSHQILCALSEMQKKNLLLSVGINKTVYYSLSPKAIAQILKDSFEDATEKVEEEVKEFAKLTEEEIAQILKAVQPQWEEFAEEVKEGFNKVRDRIIHLFN